MRKLTQPEIDAAPSWATDFIRIGKDVRYQNNKIGIFLKASEGNVQCFRGDNYRKGESIPRKEFDIREYEFYSLQWVKPLDDGDIDFTVVDGCGGQSGGLLTKQDAIALSKHFKLTASDLS